LPTGSRISLIPAFGDVVNLANLCYQHKLHSSGE
jgi:hypothetical protein